MAEMLMCEICSRGLSSPLGIGSCDVGVPGPAFWRERGRPSPGPAPATRYDTGAISATGSSQATAAKDDCDCVKDPGKKAIS